MNRRSRMQEEEKKAQGSKQEESMSSNSNDQTRRDPNNRTSRRESMESEENREGRKKLIEQDHARHSSGPVTRWGKSINISHICLLSKFNFINTLQNLILGFKKLTTVSIHVSVYITDFLDLLQSVASVKGLLVWLRVCIINYHLEE